MTRRSKIWGIAAIAFIAINALGAVYATVMGERVHMDVHLVLLLAGVVTYLMWRAKTRGRAQDALRAGQADPRIDYLQQSVDAMALEVERLGEAQRFREKLQNAPTSPQTRKDQ